jgi:tetratricopeptide (TPR) repeat protein
MRLIAAAATLALLPFAALAAGSDDTEPPPATQTSTECVNGQVWDEATKSCVDAKSGQLDDDTRFQAVRELAWAGRPEDALIVLSAMTEGQTDRVLTYIGFANRKAGRMAEGLAAYDAALALNPDNLLCRSYLGQAYVELGNIELAQLQLDQIRARGGAGLWAETALESAIRTGQTHSY